MKNTLRRFSRLFIYLVVCLELTACSNQPAVDNSMSQQAKIETLWKEGKEQTIQGENLIKTGEQMIKDGREKIRKGETARAEGQKLVESGMQLMDESLRHSGD